MENTPWMSVSFKTKEEPLYDSSTKKLGASHRKSYKFHTPHRKMCANKDIFTEIKEYGENNEDDKIFRVMYMAMFNVREWEMRDLLSPK
jgi:hypothetical protein